MIERNEWRLKRKKWVTAVTDKDMAASIAEKYSVNPLAALLACARGITGELAADFFDPMAGLSVSPFSIKDMDKAALRINKAIDNFERIAVYGDYDADGITATCLLYSYLETRGADVIRYIPDRIEEGYGLNISAVESLAQMGVRLIVTVDNGVSAVEEAKKIKELGMELVVTDHHKVGDVLPDAVAVVDPHREDCPSSFKEFAGVGVAFKLICALEGEECSDDLLDEYGDLVAIGTIGDVVTLTGENRIMVKRGLENINRDPRPGIYSLLLLSSMINKPVTASVVAFTICPRVNAAGRMGSAYKAVDLMLCDEDEAAKNLATEIQNMNSSRQSIETSIFNKARRIVTSSPEMMKDRIIVVDGEDWHQGVIGIVAARLVEEFGKPAIVISRGEGMSKGSCRSLEGFSIYDAIEACSGCLDHFGGHTLAAGIGVETGRIEEFRRAINAYAAGIEMPYPVQHIDCRIRPDSLGLDLVSSLSVLEPFGAGNSQPVFGLCGVKIEDFTGLSEGKHVRMIVSRGNDRTGVVWFGMPENMFPYSRGDIIDIAVTVDKNVYNGDARLSVVARNVRVSGMDEDAVLSGLRLHEMVENREDISREEALLALPDRDLQVAVFRYVKAHPVRFEGEELLCHNIGDNGAGFCKVLTAIDMMLEMGIFIKDPLFCISVPDDPPKVDLTQSSVCKWLNGIINGK